MSIANCTNYGCDEVLGTYNENECGRELPGGSNAVYFLECNHTVTDPSNEAQLAANVAQHLAHLVTGCSISIAKPSANIQESKVPCKPGSLSSYTRTGTYINPNVSGPNSVFHNTLFKGKKLGGLIAFECGADSVGVSQVTWIDEQILITGGRVLPGSDNEMQDYQGDIAWKSLNDPMVYEAPTNFFG